MTEIADKSLYLPIPGSAPSLLELSQIQCGKILLTRLPARRYVIIQLRALESQARPFLSALSGTHWTWRKVHDGLYLLFTLRFTEYHEKAVGESWLV